MINVIIIDDDPTKSEEIRNLVNDIVGSANVELTCEESFTGGCLRLEAKRYDVLILDLLLPREVGDNPDPQLGQTILRLIGEGDSRLNRPKYVVGLTAFHDIGKDYKDFFAESGWHLLHFDAGSEDWAIRLSRILVHASAISLNTGEENYNVDLAIVTAHTDTELEEVLKLPAAWVKKEIDGDSTLYFLGTFAGDRAVKVVAASAAKMGMPAAAVLSTKLIHHFRPRCLAMAGIAAGVKGRYGDILIADQSWDYGSGKSIRRDNDTTFEPAPEPIPVSPNLRCRLAQFRLEREVLRSIRARWPGDSPGELSAHIGPVASGAAVLENRWQIEQILAGQRKLIGVEMEAYAVFLAAYECTSPRPNVMAIKSLCDFGAADEKTDAYQQYAAFTSAQFIYEFALAYLGA
jgi:nucleoside phosphorylase/CheY-like chemotaxis protein